MKKRRLIPVLLLKDGWLVQSKGFCRYQNLGNPVTAVKRLSEWASDELIYLDITRGGEYDLRRDDINHPNRKNLLDIIEDVSRQTFMPITVGGGVRTLRDIELRLSKGADKISINTIALNDPDFISRASKEFGSQCIVVSIDVKRVAGDYAVVRNGGRETTSLHPAAWAKAVQDLGAGEIFLNSVDRDGAKTGFDIALIDCVVGAVRVPVIACGGAGEWRHFADVLSQTKADAVAAANIFHYVDQSVYLAKRHLFQNGFNVRNPDLLNLGSPP